MKKNDFIIVGVLVAMMFAWMNFYPALEKKFFPRSAQPAAASNAVRAEATPPAPLPDAVQAEEPVLQAAAEKKVAVEKPAAVEQTEVISNEQVELTVSSYGGAVVCAMLKSYPAENRTGSGPVALDFSADPALRYDSLPAAGVLERTESGLKYTVAAGDHCYFVRSLTLEGEYLLRIEESFVNESAGVWELPALRLPAGPMAEATGTTAMKGVATLGVDTFSSAAGARHWGKEFNKLFKMVPEGTSQFTSTPGMIAPQPVEWVAVKNKFFVQLLTPGESAAGFDLTVRRDGAGKRAVPVEVSAALHFGSGAVAPGQTLTRKASFYVGPKDFDFLKSQGHSQSEVMEFRSTGFWKFMNPVMYPIKTGLLWGLKALYAGVRNYGVAIMLLTLIVRVLFWPVTHKGTESMRRMQALQPLLKELQAKYKDNPQRLQMETMTLYKQHKVNPLGGCLPMLVQIPVFIALFVVLRSAVELRFSRFLWIRDLSEPENLFAGMIPLAGSLNILPLLMAATMVWQQKLTPTAAATPEQQQQQKLMTVMMPVMMLFFFYSMPSGLVLYWTTSNIIMIIQMIVKKQKAV